MIKGKNSIAFLLLAVLLLANPMLGNLCLAQKISYAIEVDTETWNSFHININIDENDATSLVFVMPAWRPGAYVRSDFGQYVSNFKAFGESPLPLNATRLNTGQWNVECGGSTSINVEYNVDHSTSRFMGKHIGASGAIVDGAMNFMYVRGMQDVPVSVSYRLPYGWKLASALSSTDTYFDLKADSYHDLIDSPALIGRSEEYYFNVGRTTFHLAVTDTSLMRMERLLIMTKRIVEYQGNLFNGFPFNRYNFLIDIQDEGHGGGGLEHHNSTRLTFSKRMLRNDINQAARVIAHEFFHVWNVKNIHPAVFDVTEYTQESRTKNLWFCEGVTSYYADLTLLRTGIINMHDFTSYVERSIEKLQSNPDRLITSVEKASLDTWENGYHSQGISYYTKGYLLGLLLDLEMRRVSSNRISMDDLFIFMYSWFAKHGAGYEERDIQRAVSSLTGVDFSNFFDYYISGVVELPYVKLLKVAGIKVEIETKEIADIGKIRLNDADNSITTLDRFGPLAKAGVKRGDVLLSIGTNQVRRPSDIKRLVESLSPGLDTEVIIIRDNIKTRLTASIGTKDRVSASLSLSEEISDKQRDIRTAIFTNGNK
ncbi:MAG: PDZ domain-containing protein [candidate division KSB1 bacterium]|nr:PDZ domain-containing protein [candidate division KSB1 bacterium]